MRLPTLNNAGAIRSYLDAFERRFVRTPEGIVYLSGETGAGIKVPAEDAAAIIAGMRRTMVDADGRTPIGGMDAVLATGFVGCLILMAGAITGYMQVAAAAIIPLAIGLIVLGPLLGGVYTELAWTRGVADAEARMAAFERMETGATRRLIRPNPARGTYYVAATLAGAVLVGLVIAAATSPSYVGASIDGWLAGVLGWVVVALVLLAFAYKTIDAVVRPRMTELDVDIAERLHRRRLLGDDD